VHESLRKSPVKLQPTTHTLNLFEEQQSDSSLNLQMQSYQQSCDSPERGPVGCTKVAETLPMATLIEEARETKDANEMSVIIEIEKKKIESEIISANALAASAQVELTKA